MPCEGKPFLTYQQQIERLNEKGITCEKPNEKKYLIRKGYFNLVNGYKRPFVSNKTTAGEHTYLPGTSIEKMYKVLKFDRRLSGMLLRNITHVEEEIRTITGYKLDMIYNEGCYDWKSEEAYDSRLDRRLVIGLINDIKNEIEKARSNNNDYIVHYSNKSDTIPTWIMTKVIRFTTLITLIQYSKKGLRKYICDLYQIEYDFDNNKFGILIGSLNWMRKTRNACAHNERVIFLEDDNRIVITKYHRLLTNAYRNRLRNKQVVDLIIFLKYYNTKREFNKLVNFLEFELNQIQEVVHFQVYESIRASLGIRDLNHLQMLKRQNKSINYLELI